MIDKFLKEISKIYKKHEKTMIKKGTKYNKNIRSSK
jgi:hypothetical protein